MADKHGGRSPRFDTPSARLDLGAVGARQMRKVRMISLVAAVVLHGSLAIWKVSMERKATKPLTTRFIKREPRLVKPLELRKAPKPKRREMRRRMKQVRAKVDTRGIRRAPKASEVLGSIVRPETGVSRVATFERPELEPLVMAEKVVAGRYGRRTLDLSLEMVDISMLDVGASRAVVIQDREDRRDVRGFFYVSEVFFRESTYPKEVDNFKLMRGRVRSSYPQALAWLAEACNQFTGLRVQVYPGVYADDVKLLEMPWVLLTAYSPFAATQAEARNFGRYLTSGGFAFAEGEADTEFPLRQAIRDALATQGLEEGRHWVFEVLKDDHPVYHTFFDFDGVFAGGGPAEVSSQSSPLESARQAIQRRDYLEGVTLNGRLVLIESYKGIVPGWGSSTHDPARMYFGINMIVFALTQEGSLAKRLMKSEG